MFFCRKKDYDSFQESQKEYILKIYNISELKSYYREVDILQKVTDKRKAIGDPDAEIYQGFPLMESNIKGEETAEILMEALGPNLRKLLRQCPQQTFSKPSVYQIII